MNNILASSSFLIINKVVLQEIGVDASIVLSHLVHRQLYYEKENQLKDGFFYNTSITISCSTTLSYYQINQALNTLKSYGFISTKLKGIPAKLHFKINKTQLLNFLKTSNEEIKELDCEITENKKLKNSKQVINKKVINKNNNINTRKEDFIKEVSKYTDDSNISNDFIDYWTEDNGKKMRFEMERTWNTSLRVKRWERNQKNFSKGSSANNMPDFLDSAYINRIKDDQAQVNKFYNHLVKNCGYERIETSAGYIRYRKRV
jgi:hypothetical protein